MVCEFVVLNGSLVDTLDFAYKLTEPH